MSRSPVQIWEVAPEVLCREKNNISSADGSDSRSSDSAISVSTARQDPLRMLAIWRMILEIRSRAVSCVQGVVVVALHQLVCVQLLEVISLLELSRFVFEGRMKNPAFFVTVIDTV